MRKNLTVILLYHPTSEIRGKLRKYFYEVKANVFVGTVSSGVREILWEKISVTTDASMIVHDNSEQGFKFYTTKNEKDYIFEDFKGIILPTSVDIHLNISELYAKTDYKLLDHLLDVGFISEALMRYGRAYNMVQSISKTTNINIDTIISSISWLCALHDIGKAHPSFIGKMYQNSSNEDLLGLWDSLLERNLVVPGDFTGFRHERFSRTILNKYFNNEHYPNESEQFANLVAYHHQGKSDYDFSDNISLRNTEWISIHEKIISIINNYWTFDREFSKNQFFVNGINYSILSIMITSDWIASGKDWKELIKKIPDKEKCAKEFIKKHELSYTPMNERFKDLSWNTVFNFDPNELQKTTIEASKEYPQLMIIEYPCGGGKTEAALSAALNIGKNKSGIFIATPTMATAKSMTKRIQDIANKINLGLNIPEFDSSSIWSDDDMDKIPSELWVSRSRHRMLYPFAVGTVDQILKTMLYYRYAAIGLMGLSDKVLIIDEVHAYDCYMIEEIKKLLKWAKFLDIPVILLSATLPSILKIELLKIMGCKKEDLPNSNEYPLITTYDKGICNCYNIECEGKKLKLDIIDAPEYMSTWNNEFSKQYSGCTAFIGSTVDKTWELLRLAQNNNLDPIMFNGRDTLDHKEKKTNLLLDKLGKDRKNRPKIMTLVSTSIIEQSLDIDIDRMFTCIAPIDLLIQRFGRVWRHSDIGTIREKEQIDIPIHIIIGHNWKDMQSSKIYNKNILEKTITILENLTELDTVKDIRQLIDSVYNDIKDIKKPKLIMDAKFKLIDSPEDDAMFDNENIQYSRFKTIQSSTRYETIPSQSIAIVDINNIQDLNENYEKMKHIIRENVVGIAEYKLNDIKVDPIKFNHKLLRDINFYDKNDLKNMGIELTEDGLKWHNN